MALSTTPVMLQHDFNGNAGHVSPSSLKAEWATVLEAGRIAGAADAAAITNPDTEIVTATSRIFRKTRGTFIALRVVHQGTGTLTSPIIVLFGRNSGIGGSWRRLFNQADTPATSVTLTINGTTDLVHTIAGASYKASDVNPKTHVWDVMECDEFLVGIETPLNATTGTESTAIVQAMCF